MAAEAALALLVVWLLVTCWQGPLLVSSCLQSALAVFGKEKWASATNGSFTLSDA
jgi:hypothetical protein